MSVYVLSHHIYNCFMCLSVCVYVCACANAKVYFSLGRGSKRKTANKFDNGNNKSIFSIAFIAWPTLPPIALALWLLWFVSPAGCSLTLLRVSLSPSHSLARTLVRLFVLLDTIAPYFAQSFCMVWSTLSGYPNPLLPSPSKTITACFNVSCFSIQWPGKYSASTWMPFVAVVADQPNISQASPACVLTSRRNGQQDSKSVTLENHVKPDEETTASSMMWCDERAPMNGP